MEWNNKYKALSKRKKKTKYIFLDLDNKILSSVPLNEI